MKVKLIYLALLAFVFSFTVNAQQQQKSELTPEQKIELRAQRISNKLMLDEKTSSKFVPLYKEYVSALKAALPEKSERKGELTDAQRIERLQKRYEAEAKVADVKKKYVAEFAKILTPRQVEKLMTAKQWQGKKNFGKKGGNNPRHKMHAAKGCDEKGKKECKKDSKK